MLVLEHILMQIHNNTYITGLYQCMHVTYTFAEAELVKAALQQSILTTDFAPKLLTSLYFSTSFLTCHKC